MWTSDEVGNSLWQWGQFLEQATYQFLERTRVETPLLHLLRRGVVGLHAHRRELQRIGPVYIGMGHVDAVVEDGGFTEYDIFDTDLIGLLGIFPALEPHEVHDTRSVAEMGHHTFLAWAHLEGLETENFADNLNERHVARQLVDGIDLRTVDILVRVIVDQVTISEDSEFFTQNLLAAWSYA